MQANMNGNAAQYCHSIHRHDTLSEYQPSSEAATFCEPVDNEALRKIAGNEADGERDESPGPDACKKLRREEGGKIG
jgi:hypothetical protein